MTAIKNGTLLVKDSNGNTARVATLSQTDITTLNTALTDIEANSVSIQSLTNQVKTIQGRYVDVDTQQDISGLKVFNRSGNGIICKEETMDVNVVPTSEISNFIKWQDKNAHNVGMVKSTHETGNWHRMEMTAIAQDSSGKNIYGQLAVSIKPDGSIRTSCPQPPVNSNDLSIATTSWSNSRYVTLDTGQDIFAGKTFAGDDTATLNLRSSVIDLDNPASINLNGKVLFFSDKKNKNIGSVYSGVYNGTYFDGVFTRLQVRNEKSTGEKNTPYLEVQARNSGLNLAFAPSNISHSYLTEIATTDWVYQRANINEITAWKIANGLCVTAVQFITTAGQLTTYTFPIPYNSTPIVMGSVYNILATNSPNTPQFYCSVTNVTKTSFQAGLISNGYLGQGIVTVIVVGDIV